ncbi:MAG: hypothetical protein WEB52_04045 [Dehalococcoidia bacterium]
MQWGSFGQKTIAIVAGVTLVSLAAVGAFASQELATVQEETPTVEGTETATATATETSEATATPTETPEATETAEPTSTATGTPESTATATGTPDDGDDGDGEGEGQREIGGIPEDHPVFVPDEDGECEKHETRVKTTPSGRQVRVPCHAAGGDDDGDARPGRGHKKGAAGDE